MEISLLSKESIKIKGKRTSFIVDPDNSLRVKEVFGPLLLLRKDTNIDVSKIGGEPLLVQGPGEYEFSGLKMTVVSCERDLIYTIDIDGLEVFLANVEVLKKIKDLTGDHSLVILKTNTLVDQSLIALLAPRLVILYGDKAGEEALALGKGKTLRVQKLKVQSEKLPEETEVVVLG